MGRMVGADVGELKELAEFFHRHADQLQAVEDRLHWRIHSAPWHGGDVDQFTYLWDRSYRWTIRSAADDLRRSSALLLRQAAQQQAASSGVGGLSAAARRIQEGRRTGPGKKSSKTGGPGLVRSLIDKAGLVGLGMNVGTLAKFWRESGATWPTIRNLSKFYQHTRLSVALDGVMPWETLGTLGKVAKVGGGALGAIGVVGDGWQMVDDINKGDTIGAILSGSSGAIGAVGVVALIPGVNIAAGGTLLVAGTVVGVTSLVYHNREAIGSAAAAVGRGISSGWNTVAGWAVDSARGVAAIGSKAKNAVTTAGVVAGRAVGSAVGHVKDAAGGTAGRVKDAVGSAADAGADVVKKLVRKPSWLF